VPRGARAAQVCLYGESDDDPTDRARLSRGVLLDRSLARTLTRLMSDAPARGSSLRGCVVEPVVVRLLTAAGRSVDFTVSGCSPAFVTHGRDAARLSPTAADVIGAMASSPLDKPVVPTPSFVGLSVARAAARARDLRVRPFYAELRDDTAPAGTVIWQGPFPGGPQDVGEVEVSLYVAVGRPPACRGGQVVGRYLDGGRGTGNHFGNIALVDVLSRPCALRGTLRLRGEDRGGRAVTPERSVRLGDELVLGPDATLAMVTQEAPAALIAAFMFSGNERDDATPDGLCHGPTRPARWRVTIGRALRMTVRNADGSDSFASCHGRFGVDEPRLRP
jgi:hypothetical protein